MYTIHGNWEDERETLLNAVGGALRERVADTLDKAAAAARSEDLRAAARWVDEARRAMVEIKLFESWDNGIWVFTSIMQLIRGMSSETKVPRRYQKLLDAIPSAHIESRMSFRQTAFWYGRRWWE